MPDITCSIPECGKPSHCRGWCRSHYGRWQRTGNPLPVPTPVIDRIWDRVDTGPSCWLWTGTLDKDGYAKIKVDGSNRRAHRLVFELTTGPIPSGMTIDHTCHPSDGSCPGGIGCRHRRCLNPTHLRLASIAENVMRGVGPLAEKARQTHCKRGHPLSGANLYLWRGQRACNTCRSDYRRRRRHQLAIEVTVS